MCNELASVDKATDITAGRQYPVSGKKENKNIKENHFPFTLLYILQDQKDEILAIDINATLDMYVTISRDGTIALRCLRTSKLWQHFKILYRHTVKNRKNENEKRIKKGFTKNFLYINALKLSLHGYIVVIGQSSRQ